jgi:hypothetical protein
MRAVGVEKAATVGAEHLDAFLRRDRTEGDQLLAYLLRNGLAVRSRQRNGLRLHKLRARVRLEGLHHALRNEEQRRHQ